MLPQALHVNPTWDACIQQLRQVLISWEEIAIDSVFMQLLPKGGPRIVRPPAYICHQQQI